MKTREKKKEFETRLLLEARQEVAVLDYLEKQHTATIQGISQELGIPVSRVTSILNSYQGMGFVRKSAHTYRLLSIEEERASCPKKQLTLFSQ